MRTLNLQCDRTIRSSGKGERSIHSLELEFEYCAKSPGEGGEPGALTNRFQNRLQRRRVSGGRPFTRAPGGSGEAPNATAHNQEGPSSHLRPQASDLELKPPSSSGSLTTTRRKG